MSVQATNGDARTGAMWNAPSRALAIEKPRQTASSDDRDPQPEERRGSKPTRRSAYHFDTVGVSGWDGPMLRAPYAAQVIGQALEMRVAPPPPRTAYREPAVAVARVFDRRL
jgi:hypothetical protein